MKKNRLVSILFLALALAAVAAYATGPTLSTTVWDFGRNIYVITASPSGGAAPYTYEWRLDGGAWTAGNQIESIYCLVYDTLAARVVDDNGAISNVETFTCP